MRAPCGAGLRGRRGQGREGVWPAAQSPRRLTWREAGAQAGGFRRQGREPGEAGAGIAAPGPEAGAGTPRPPPDSESEPPREVRPRAPGAPLLQLEPAAPSPRRGRAARARGREFNTPQRGAAAIPRATAAAAATPRRPGGAAHPPSLPSPAAPAQAPRPARAQGTDLCSRRRGRGLGGWNGTAGLTLRR